MAAAKSAKRAADRFVWYFGGGEADGDGTMKDVLGGKGAGLAEMARIGLPVPAGFTISTGVCAHVTANRGKYPKGLERLVDQALARVEREMGAKFGDAQNPLLVSVRSGAKISMPGMMDTVLNLGLNDVTVEGLAAQSRNPRFAWDCYRRFVQMFGDVVLGMKPQSKTERDPFELLLEAKKHERGVKLDSELAVDDLKALVATFKAEIKSRTGRHFAEDPKEQLWASIAAVFGSWNNERAIVYRRLNRIPNDMGTAVNVCAMVYGNMGEDSGTGVAFTRNPSNGEKVFFGEYLLNAQGEDVVAGIRTPKPILEMKKEMPKVHAQLERVRATLEKHYREMQDVEFTIQRGRLWMLQTRTGKRTGFAAVRIAVDMVNEKLISDKEALLRLDPESLNQLLRPVFDAKAKDAALKEDRLLGKGLPAGPGAACGRIAFHAEDAIERKRRGEPVILVRVETSPEDIEGMNASLGILTSRGGMTSHAALVGRQMGKVCVVGCGELAIDYAAGTITSRGKTLKAGDFLSIEGNSGEVFAGEIQTRPSEVLQVLLEKSLAPSKSPAYQRYAKLLSWADQHRRLGVRANADQGDQCQNAVAFGAEGVGLCRTEHMFFGAGKIEHVQHMILASSADDRRAALANLLPIQRADFAAIFKAMNGRPVTIRTLDPPLHEFLPHTEHDQKELGQKLGVDWRKIAAKVEELHEFNPMLGFRGCRLGIVHPEITEMQARAIFEACCEVKASGVAVRPEIMIPLVGTLKELQLQAALVRKTAELVMHERATKIGYLVGTMIEVPRAALTAGDIAKEAEFFSFGTNDLTQTTMGLSRDDSGRFLDPYVKAEIYAVDPFQSLDTKGVGQLVEMATQRGRAAHPGLKVGICGEHGGDPSSIEFFHTAGLDYVSCSPFRIPIARVAAAQAALREQASASAKASGSSSKAKAKANKAGRRAKVAAR
jgi:pyruvate,orthophosphate dikinase